jgi:branched-chain amino acid transport system permease protein
MHTAYVMVYLQILINGLLLGGLYACMAIGFSVIWGVMNIINLAHGSMIIMGAYITYWIWTTSGVDPFATLPVSAAALFCFGFFLQKYLLNRIVATSVFLSLIFTFGLDMVLTNVHLELFQADLRAVTTDYATSGLVVGSLYIPYARLAVFATAIALTLLLMGFMNRTRTGNAIKSTSFDVEAAELVGINTKLIYSITFAIGAMMAGIAGSLIATVYQFSPFGSVAFTTKSFVVVILGGLGSIPGAIAGGIVLAVAEAYTAYWRPGYVDLVSFALLLAILITRRRGLFGKRFYAEI